MSDGNVVMGLGLIKLGCSPAIVTFVRKGMVNTFGACVAAIASMSLMMTEEGF